MFPLALWPHQGDWFEGGVLTEADDLNQPLVGLGARNLAPQSLSSLRVGGHPVVLSALKGAEDGEGLILRLYEPAGGRGALQIEPPQGWRIEGPPSIMEEPMEGKQGEITPFAVHSYRLRRA